MPPQTEFGDRINQLDINVVKSIKIGHSTLQPKFDLFNVLNRSPVHAVPAVRTSERPRRCSPQSILVGRVFQLGAFLRFLAHEVHRVGWGGLPRGSPAHCQSHPATGQIRRLLLSSSEECARDFSAFGQIRHIRSRA